MTNLTGAQLQSLFYRAERRAAHLTRRDKNRRPPWLANEILDALAKKHGRPNAAFLPTDQIGQFLTAVERWDKADDEAPF